MDSNFKIIVVEDEVFIAEDIRDTLEDLGYQVCAVCFDSESATKELHRCQPNLAILDITIRGQKDGIALAEIINQYHKIPFIYLTSHSDKSTLDKAIATNPDGYIVKPFKDKDLSTAIQIAIHNHSERLKRQNLDKSVVDLNAAKPLSEQEYSIFLDIVDGLNNRQIGEKRFLSVNTIKTYVKRIFDKLDVNDRVGAVRKVISS